jgi:TonB family protein
LFVAGAAVTAYLTLWGGHPSNLPTAVASKATLGRLPQPVVPRSGPSFNSELVDEAGLGMDPVGASQGASLIAMDANATRDPATTPAGRGSPEPSEPKATASRSSVPIPVAKERGEGRSRDSSTRHETDVAAATVLPPIAKVDPSDGVDSRPGTSAEPEEIVSRASGSVEEVVEDPLAQSSPPPTQLSAETAMAPAQPTLHRAKIQRGSLIDINEVDSLPTPISRPDPEYPTFSQRMRHEGRVVLNLLIDENGRVIDIDVIDGVPRTRLDQAAIDAARRWIYRPALKDGVAVKVWKTAEFIFRL